MKITDRWLNSHNWMLRSDNDGKSYDDFSWNKINVWTDCPDFDDNSVCGNGLHGINKQYNNFGIDLGQSRIVLCEIDKICVIDNEKIKTNKAKIVAINSEIPEKAFEQCNIRIMHDGDNLNIDSGVYLLFSGEVTITQSGGACRAYDNATINNTQSGGYCRAYNNATINKK